MIKNKHVLLVEDIFKTIRGSVKELERKGVNFTVAPTVINAEELLRNTAFDLILLDLRLPSREDPEILEDKAGQRIIMQLRQGRFGDLNKDVAFIVVTAQNKAVDEEDISAYGNCLGTFGKLQAKDIIDAVECFLVEPGHEC